MMQNIIFVLYIIFFLSCQFSTFLWADVKIFLQKERNHKFDDEINVIDIRSKKSVWLPIPDFVKYKKFKFLQISKETYRVEIETFAPIPNGVKDNLSFTVFFKYDSDLYAIGVTCGLGHFIYRSPPPSRFKSLQGGVFSYLVEPGRPRWIGPLKRASINGNKLTFDFSSKFIQSPKNLHRFIIRYLPYGFISREPGPPIADGIDFEFKGGKEVFYMIMKPLSHP